MFKKLKSKRMIAFLLLMITLLSTIQPVFAVSGTGSWVSGQFASYIKTTDNANTQYGVLLRKLINYSTNETRTVFCAEHGIDINTGTIYKGSYYTPVDSRIRKACKVAYLGWYKDQGNYIIDGGTSNALKKQYVLTQQFIWETLGQSNATFMDSSIQAEYVNFKANIENQIAQIEKRPSFDGTTITVQAGESKTLNDSNGVLSAYPNLDRTTNGIRVQHTRGSNSMTITADENLLMIIIISIIICSIVFIFKPKKDTQKDINSIIGNWRIEGNTNNEIYEFYEDGKGVLILPNSNYAFSYTVEEDKLHIDFEYEKAEDPDYKIIFENDKIHIEGINPTTGKFTFIKSN